MTSANLGSKPVDVYASRRKWRNPSGTRTYYAWRSMRHRCCNPSNASWANYGGRGITVCERWANDYDAFFEDMGEAPEGKSLERVDVDKGYYPENCVWASDLDQGRNKRNNRLLTYDGKTMCLSEWAEFLGVNMDTLHRRLNVYKMPLDKALSRGSLALKWKHGTRRGYEMGCKCSECRGAHASHCRAMRQKRKEKRSAAG